MEPERLPHTPSERPSLPPRPVMDILPKARQIAPPRPQEPLANVRPTQEPALDVLEAVKEEPPIVESKTENPKRPRNKAAIVAVALAMLVLLIIGGVVGGNMWYQAGLQPLTTDKSSRIRVT